MSKVKNILALFSVLRARRYGGVDESNPQGEV